jgi:hypothetical protein
MLTSAEFCDTIANESEVFYMKPKYEEMDVRWSGLMEKLSRMEITDGPELIKGDSFDMADFKKYLRARGFMDEFSLKRKDSYFEMRRIFGPVLRCRHRNVLRNEEGVEHQPLCGCGMSDAVVLAPRPKGFTRVAEWAEIMETLRTKTQVTVTGDVRDQRTLRAYLKAHIQCENLIILMANKGDGTFTVTKIAGEWGLSGSRIRLVPPGIPSPIPQTTTFCEAPR